MKHFSDETRKKMSESAKRRCSDPKWLEKQHMRGTQLPLDVVRYMYESGNTQEEIAKSLGVSQKVVCRFMKNNGIKSRVSAKRNQFAELNSNWKGGIVKDDSGYILEKCVGHKRAKSCGDYVRQHILVAEKMIGRPLKDDEVVHHINMKKDDNRPENLMVMKRSDHTRLHMLGRKKNR